MATAVVRFSGICTHVRRGHAPEAGGDPNQHRVMLPDGANPALIGPDFQQLPPHDAYLVVATANISACIGFAPRPADKSFRIRLADNAAVAIAPAGDFSPEPLTYAAGWSCLPSIHALALAGSVIAPDVSRRRAGIVHISHGRLSTVDFDARSGDTSSEWSFEAPSGRVAIAVAGPGGPRAMEVTIPPGGPGPVEPLIQIENVGRDRDDPEDFRFHFYMLFNEGKGAVPLSRGIVEGGIGTGCSNSIYP